MIYIKGTLTWINEVGVMKVGEEGGLDLRET